MEEVGIDQQVGAGMDLFEGGFIWFGQRHENDHVGHHVRWDIVYSGWSGVFGEGGEVDDGFVEDGIFEGLSDFLLVELVDEDKQAHWLDFADVSI
jgi:hypothetical protein